jgi:hypothetical protein
MLNAMMHTLILAAGLLLPADAPKENHPKQERNLLEELKLEPLEELKLGPPETLGTDRRVPKKERYPLEELKQFSPQTRLEQFGKWHRLIKPHGDPLDAPWYGVAWEVDLWEARKKAATEGKPLCIWIATGEPAGAA